MTGRRVRIERVLAEQIRVCHPLAEEAAQQRLRTGRRLQPIRDREVLRRLATFTQSPDHPIVPSIPETEYLKGYAYEIAR